MDAELVVKMRLELKTQQIRRDDITARSLKKNSDDQLSGSLLHSYTMSTDKYKSEKANDYWKK